jgi:hypothetical protein
MEALGPGLTARSVLLHLALGCETWRSLVRKSGPKQPSPVDLMIDAVRDEK